MDLSISYSGGLDATTNMLKGKQTKTQNGFIFADGSQIFPGKLI